MCGWNPIRDTLESVASLAGNYFLPGSSLLTDHLVSKGSQRQLGSTLGQLAQAGTGFAGGGFGQDFTGIPSASDVGAGWTNAGNGLGSLFGDPTLATDVGNGISSFGSQLSDGISNAGEGISNGLGFGNPQGFGTGLSDADSAFAPASAASSAPGTIASGFNPTTGTGGIGGGSSGGFFQADPSAITGGNSTSGFLSAPDTSAATGGLVDNSALNSYGSAAGATPTAAAVGSQEALQTLSPGGNKVGLASLFSNSNLSNGVARAGLSTLFNQNPYAGNGQIANTLNSSAAQYNPYIQNGQAAQKQLGNLNGLNGQAAATAAQQDWQNTPGYQFQLQQGLGALQNSAAASGGLLNGNTGQALINYGQNAANTQYQQYLSNLQNQAGQGAGAIGSQGQLQGQAAQLNAQPGQYQANQNNQGISGLLSSLFPAHQNNGSSGFLSLFG